MKIIYCSALLIVMASACSGPGGAGTGGGAGGGAAGGSAGTGGGSAGGSGGGSATGGSGGAGGTGGTGGAGCVPSCQMKICGPDGCGGTCGSCAATETCNAAGRCVCVPESDAAFCQRLGKSCGGASGTDNCGVSRAVADCGACTAPQTCGGAGTPGACGCAPQCQGRVCGADGCGGTCGTCIANASCLTDQSGCVCNGGYLPDPTGNTCLQAGVPSPSLSAYPRNGYCIGGRYWLIPDPVHGLYSTDCGVGQCRADGNGGYSGSCTCGANGTALPSLTTSGFCPQGSTWGGGLGPHEAVITCFAGNIYYDNCIGLTGQQTAVCSTFVTQFGNNSNCYCAPCTAYDPQTRTCAPHCPAGFTCHYDPSTSITTCL